MTPDVPVTIALLGSKGGVGTSILAANLAIYLATLGKRVIAVDASPCGSDLGSRLGMPPHVPPYHAPIPAFGADAEVALPWPEAELDIESANPLPSREPVEGPLPTLSLLHAGVGEPYRGTSRRSSLKDLQARLGKLDAQYFVVDLGAVLSDAAVSFWSGCEHRLAVAAPDPSALHGLYRLLRKSFAHSALQAAQDETQRAVLEEAFARAGNMPAPMDMARLEAAQRPELGRLLRQRISSMRFPFVINQARVRADIELGDQLGVASRRRYGVRPQYLGFVEHDDTVRMCAHRGKALLLETPGCRASRNIEKIARRLFASSEARRKESHRNVPANSHHDALEVDRGASDEEIRRAYKRMCAVFDADNIASSGLFDADGLAAVRARIDEAYDVLLDHARRRPYELSIFPETALEPNEEPEPEEPEAELPPAPTITPDTEFTGALIRAVRQSQGTSLKQISESTKVGTNYLRCIEEEDFESLPAAVYVRGFVTEVAKCLKLDPDQVSRTYSRRHKNQMTPKKARVS
jgi:flagellar biosynthesis protein FlhG